MFSLWDYSLGLSLWSPSQNKNVWDKFHNVKRRLNGAPRERNIYLWNRINPSIKRITSNSKIWFAELIHFWPTKRCVSKTFLYDGMEPGKQEIHTSSFTRSLGKETNEVYWQRLKSIFKHFIGGNIKLDAILASWWKQSTYINTLGPKWEDAVFQERISTRSLPGLNIEMTIRNSSNFEWNQVGKLC